MLGTSKAVSADSIGDATKRVLDFLQEQGFTTARRELEAESGIKLTEERKNAKTKTNYLIHALDVYEEYLNSKNSDDSASQERKLEDHLMNPKGGVAKPAVVSRTTMAKHESNVIDARFCRNSTLENLVASADVRGNIIFSHLQTGDSVTVVKPGVFKAPILSLDFSPKDNTLAVACMSGGHFTLNVDLKDSTSLFKKESSSGTDLKVSWSADEKHGKYVNRIRWDSTGTMFATCSYDKEVRIYHLKASKDGRTPQWGVAGRFTFRRGVECIEWGLEARKHLLYVSLQSDNYIHSIDAVKMKKAERYNMNSFGDDHVSFSALDLHTSKDGKYLLACTDKDRTIMFASNTEKQVRNFYGADSGKYFNPRAVLDQNQSCAYGTSYDNSIVVWDVGSQRVVKRLTGHKKMIRSLDVHSTKNIFASGSYDRTIRLWEPKQ